MSKFAYSEPVLLVVTNEGFLISETRKETSVITVNVNTGQSLTQLSPETETLHWIYHQALVLPTIEED